MGQKQFTLILFISVLILGMAAISACGFFGVGRGTANDVLYGGWGKTGENAMELELRRAA